MKQGTFMHTFLQFLNTQPLLKSVHQEAGAVTGSIIDIIKLQFAWRSYAAPVLAIDNLTIGPGERVFIEGPSGSGKSTLLNLLAGVVTPDHGTLSVLGRHLGEMSGAARDRFRADHVGIIFQMFNLIPYLSVVENVTLPCRFSRLRRDKAVRNGGSVSAEAMRLLTHLEMNGPDLLSRPVNELSVGQQQRVAAARALIGSPDLLIADEPTSSLDVNLRESFIQLLFAECASRGTTLIFVSHDPALEKLFDHTVRLADINSPEQSPIHMLEGGK
jgi:putative ABC transport system ATP-binding protein